MRVMTVQGPVAPTELGIVLPHEHLIVDLRHSLLGFDAMLDDVDLAIDEVVIYAKAGGGTIVEVSNTGMGRDVRALRRIAEATGVKIVAVTGYYTEPYYPREVYELTINRLADRMIAELTEGIDGTGIRAGLIGEIGTRRDFVTPAEERVFRAAGRAHKATGAPITTHTFLEQLIHDQIDILEDEGVDPGQIIIGHLGDYRDRRRLSEIARRGVYLEIDHIGYPVQQRDEERARTVAFLIDTGYLSRILLSLDICIKSRLHAFGGTGYDCILSTFLPHLKACGVGEAEIRAMLIDNPQRALAYDV